VSKVDITISNLLNILFFSKIWIFLTFLSKLRLICRLEKNIRLDIKCDMVRKFRVGEKNLREYSRAEKCKFSWKAFRLAHMYVAETTATSIEELLSPRVNAFRLYPRLHPPSRVAREKERKERKRAGRKERKR